MTKIRLTICIFSCLFCLFCCVLQVNLFIFIRFIILRERSFDKVTKEFSFINEDTYVNKTVNGIIGNITVVTQLSENRMNILNILAKKWRGPIVAVLYFPKNLELESKIKQLQKKFPYIFRKVHLNIFIKNHGPYPMNKLRNFGLQQVKTPLVFYLDVDFIPSNNIHEKIIEFSTGDEFKYVLENKAVLVFPAFHWNCSDSVQFLNCERGKPIYDNHPSQKSTNYSQWFKTDQIYEIEYNLLYEPYVIGSIKMPEYDPSFTLGNDKTSFTYELRAIGYKFYVAPEAYVGHIPHQKNVKWALDQAEYDIREAWHKWHKFSKRINSMYKFNMFCERYLLEFPNSIPGCVCMEFGCLY